MSVTTFDGTILVGYETSGLDDCCLCRGKTFPGHDCV